MISTERPLDPLAPSAHDRARSSSQIRGDLARVIFRGALLCSKAMLVPYAYVIFDLYRAAALKTVNGYLDDIGGAYCGRYGDMRTDESSKSRELAAEKALNMQPSRAAVSK